MSDLPFPRVRVLPHMPFSVLFGGFERGCQQAVVALRQIGCPVEMLDWANPEDTYDILHVFSETGNWYDIALHLPKSRALVVSAIAGAGRLSAAQRFRHAGLWQLATHLGGGKTNYDRARAVAQRAAAFLCLNTLEQAFYLSKFCLDPARVRVIPNGVAEHRFAATPDLFAARYGRRDYVLYVGNIVERKHPLLLAQVLVQRGLPGVFIGAPLAFQARYGQAFRDYVAAHPQQLLWIENLAYNDPLLDSAYAGASVFCLPSALETQPLAAMEAMATGTRLVLGNAAYAFEAPFEQATRCVPGDAASLAAAVTAAMEAPPVCLPDRYRWPQVAAEMAAVYRAVAAER